MNMREIVERTAASLPGPPTYVFANLFEANQVMDKIASNLFPVAIYIAPTDANDDWSSSATLYARQEVQIAFMDRYPEENDPTTEQVWITVIEPMLALAREFYKKIDRDVDVAVTPGQVGDISYQVVYSQFDARLFGVIAVAEVPYSITQPTCN